MLALGTSPAAAQAPDSARVHPRDGLSGGLELGLGGVRQVFQGSLGANVGYARGPLYAAVRFSGEGTPRGASPYEREEGPDGERLCRDQSTGLPASDRRCGGLSEAVFSPEGGLRFQFADGAGLAVGVGHRFGWGGGPYGAAAVHAGRLGGSGLVWRAEVGRRHALGSVGASFAF